MLLHVRNAWQFARQPASHKEVVFFSESAADWPHLAPILESVVTNHQQPVSVLASTADDPALQWRHAGVSSFLIGEGTVRTMLLRTLDARVVVMTMPDLDVFHIRRSTYPVHYVYLFHAINSSHMIYRADAFDAFDTVLCVGPHHVAEIRAREAKAGLKRKQLIPHGSSRLDRLILAPPIPPPPIPLILIAPSWGPSSIVEHGIDILIAKALDAGYRVRLRPHPMQWRQSDKVLQLQARFNDRPGFELERSVHTDDSFLEASLLVSDWSGAALEYGLGLGRPVLFIDTPRKIRNTAYEELGIEPVEIGLRSLIGRVIAPDDLADAANIIGTLLAHPPPTAERLAKLRSSVVFHPGHSAGAGAAAIVATLRELPPAP